MYRRDCWVNWLHRCIPPVLDTVELSVSTTGGADVHLLGLLLSEHFELSG